MGGKSSSASTTKTETTQTDERIAATDSAQVFTLEGNNNTLTDLGAIEKAGEISFEVINTLGEIALKSLNQTQSAVDVLGINADKTFEFVDQQNTPDDSRTITKLAPWLLVGVSVLAMTGTLKFK